MNFAEPCRSDTTRSLLAGLEQAIDAVVMIDAQNNVTHFNAAAERMWGYSRDEVLGCNVSCLVPAPFRQNHDEHIGANRSTGVNRIVGRSREVRIERKDGTELWGALSMSRIEVDGEITYMGFVRDVTVEVQQREEIARLSLVVDKTRRAVFIADGDVRINYVNNAFTDLFGFSREEACGLTPDELLNGAYTDLQVIERLHHLVLSEGTAEEELLVYNKDGNEVWVSTAVNAIRDNQGNLRHIVALLTDITESKQLQSLQHRILEALADERPLLNVMDDLCRKVEKLAPDVICSLAHVDAAGDLHPLGGPSMPRNHGKAMKGLRIAADGPSDCRALYHGESLLVQDIAAEPKWQRYAAAVLAAGLKACWITPIKAKDGRVIGTFSFYFRECRTPSRWHRSIVDACVHLGALALEREEARNEISRLAYFDALTGLPNRTQMRHLMERGVAECARGESLAVMFLDLDHFKDVNDTLGHSAGDELLVQVTQRLRSNLRPGDVVSRQGGDEFVVMLPACEADGAERIAERFTEVLSAPLHIAGNKVAISVSAGISIYPDNASDLDSLLKYADTAMYSAKQAGRSTYRFFSNQMDGAAQDRLALSTALRDAIAHGGLHLHYQPQIRAVGGELYGVEALARWNDPVLGAISPGKFIPLAEECGLIDQIGLWSLREACRQIAAWECQGLDIPCVSVNLSPISFENPDLPTSIIDMLAEYGLTPDRLALEVTESVVMNCRWTISAPAIPA
jgi:diguanylate cyclase (GGDEF)-like protein/PAS domain S-box-containing protein